MAFRTKIDFSDNRQAKQRIETIQELSGATHFGVTFSSLPSGVDAATTGVSQTYTNIASTFSGNSGTTNYTWYDTRMSIGEPYLSALTPSNSAITQTTGQVYIVSSASTIDGNTVNLTYTGVSYSILPISIYDLGGGNYSGTVSTTSLHILSARTLDFTGRTIWVDVSGITRTEKLIVTNNPVIGYVLTCVNSEGLVSYMPSSGSTSGDTGLWSAGTGSNSVVVKNSGSIGSGAYSLAEGNSTTASGDNSHAEGQLTIASGYASHAEGNSTTASGSGSHAEGYQTTATTESSHAEGSDTTASGRGSHAEGSETTASGDYSHAEGNGANSIGVASHAEGIQTTAIGDGSHAGGYQSIASGTTSFVHGSNSIAYGICSVVLGDNLSGTTDNTVFVNKLNVKTVGAGPGLVDIGVDANGNVVDQASDLKLKENINTITNALNTVLALRGVTYNWKDRSKGGNALKLGFIAQEVDSVIPELAYYNPNGEYMGVHYKDVTALLVEAVKELASGVTSVSNTHLETQTILAEDNNIELNYNGNTLSSIGGGITVLHAMGENLDSKLVTDNEGNWITNNDFKSKSLTIPTFTPLSSLDGTGNIGNITRDDNYLYVKTINGWKRSNLESF